LCQPAAVLISLTLFMLISAAAPPAIADDWENCIQERRLALAIKGCTRLLRRDPRNITANYHRARAYERSGRIGRAIADRSRIIRVDPSSFAYRARGLLFRLQGDYKRAVRDFSKAIELNPTNNYAYYDRAVVSEGKGDYGAAIADYTRAIAIDPDNVKQLKRRARAYLKSGNPSRGLPDVERALELRPNDPAALAIRALLRRAIAND
jgi:tetratricopeptide (TPR) repeat protein